MAEEMGRTCAGVGIPCVASDSSSFLEMMHRIVVAVSKRVNGALVIVADREDILHETVLDQTHATEVEVTMAAGVETVCAVHRASIP